MGRRGRVRIGVQQTEDDRPAVAAESAVRRQAVDSVLPPDPWRDQQACGRIGGRVQRVRDCRRRHDGHGARHDRRRGVLPEKAV